MAHLGRGDWAHSILVLALDDIAKGILCHLPCCAEAASMANVEQPCIYLTGISLTAWHVTESGTVRATH